MRWAQSIVFLLLSSGSLHSQHVPSADPLQVNVAYTGSNATPMQAIAAVALQSKVPLAILYGRDRTILCQKHQSFELSGISSREAISQIASGAGYQAHVQDGVIELKAPDLTPWQEELLNHEFDIYQFRPKAVLNALFTQLQGALLMDAEGATGYGGSTLYSPSAIKFNLPEMHHTTTEQIANRLVKLDSHAIWIFRGPAERSKDLPGDQFDIYSYRDDSGLIAALSCH